MPHFLYSVKNDELSYGFRELDGDIAKVAAIDLFKDGGVSPRRGSMVNRGRAVYSELIPEHGDPGGAQAGDARTHFLLVDAYGQRPLPSLCRDARTRRPPVLQG